MAAVHRCDRDVLAEHNLRAEFQKIIEVMLARKPFVFAVHSNSYASHLMFVRMLTTLLRTLDHRSILLRPARGRTCLGDKPEFAAFRRIPGLLWTTRK